MADAPHTPAQDAGELKPCERVPLESVTPELATYFRDDPCLIWSGEWQKFWRANGQGYTTDQAEAGRYTLADAYARTRHCGPEKQIAFTRTPSTTVRESPQDASERVGWKLVPIEPTADMVAACFPYAYDDSPSPEQCVEIWRSMLAAAPSRPGSSTGGEEGMDLDRLWALLEPFEQLARDVDAAVREHLGVGLDGLTPDTPLPVGGDAINSKCKIAVSALLAALSRQPAEQLSASAEVAELREALAAVADAMLSGTPEGGPGDYGWSITKLNCARPLIRAALSLAEKSS